MILVDTSIWVEHLRAANPHLMDVLADLRVAIHPFVVGELAVGNLRDRSTVLSTLQGLPEAVRAQDSEVLSFVHAQRLHGRGLSYIDVHLLASSMLSENSLLWTSDRRLHESAQELGIAYLGR